MYCCRAAFMRRLKIFPTSGHLSYCHLSYCHLSYCDPTVIWFSTRHYVHCLNLPIKGLKPISASRVCFWGCSGLLSCLQQRMDSTMCSLMSLWLSWFSCLLLVVSAFYPWPRFQPLPEWLVLARFRLIAWLCCSCSRSSRDCLSVLSFFWYRALACADPAFHRCGLTYREVD